MSASVQHERIELRNIEQEMRESFIDYSMSVIVQRALPDARDGLKPVHRRILYAMRGLGLLPERPYKKSATVVGDVLGKYHPHGDTAVYDTLVRMVQDFSLRYPLVDGQGNFGSIDGDSAAAYRYTEVRLTPFALELLAQIDSETVDFRPNFDGRLQEPEVLPSRVPHLLLNGADGIAVGMATKIPPQNLGELLRATEFLVNNPECQVEDLLPFVKGPDFPTGGYIWGRQGIRDAYLTGRGLIDMRARIHVEEGAYGKTALVVTELPYQVNKTRVIEQITRLVRAGRADVITELRDESDRDGIRLVIELKRDADSRKLAQTLFKKTQLRATFGVIMLALVDGRPRELNLKQALACFVNHRLEVIRREAAYLLARSEARAHVVEGLMEALDRLDRVIELIRTSDHPDAAREALRSELGLSEPQAQAILAMRLAQLTGLEARRLGEELDELRTRIEELRHLAGEESSRREFLVKDLRQLVEAYADSRRTAILDGEGEFPLPTGANSETTLVLLTRKGYVKAQPARGGTGMAGAAAMATRPRDFVRQAFLCRSTHRLLILTTAGYAYRLDLASLPRGTRSSRGQRLTDHVELAPSDRVATVVAVPVEEGDRFLLLVTRQGRVKRTPLSEYSRIRAGGVIATGLANGDEVLSAFVTDGSMDLILAAGSGQVIRFRESEIRPMGRTARGVRGVELETGDSIVAALAPRRASELLAATSRGFGKRIPLTELRLQGRAGKGTTILPDGERVGRLVGLLEVLPTDRLMWETGEGDLVEVASDRVPTGGRRAAAVRIVDVQAESPDIAAVHTLRAGAVEAGADVAEAAGGAAEAAPNGRDPDPPQTELELAEP
ncbi:MAG: DNA gyrase subunit A [Gemmatimonadota bacterium]